MSHMCSFKLSSINIIKNEQDIGEINFSDIFYLTQYIKILF